MIRALASSCLLFLSACTGGLSATDPPDPVRDDARDPGPLIPAEARLHRITGPRYRARVRGLLGVPVRTSLPVDYRLHGFTSVGAAELSISASDLDRYEEASWEVAAAALPDADARDARLGCALDRIEAPAACVAPWAIDLAHRAWTRPIDQQDVDLLLDVFDAASEISGDPTVATQAVVATILQSPWFLFRAEVGLPTADPLHRRLSEHELAARLADFLIGGAPDDALLADADAGRLGEDEVLREHAERLLAQDGAEAHLGQFFRELVDLDRLETVDKDPDLYPHITPELRQAMALEVEQLFTDVVLTQDADFRTLLTTDRAYVTPLLAAHYGLPALSEPTWMDLPEDQERGGLLGRAGFLSIEAHAAATSPTHRGLFVQTRLLCTNVDPPPEGIETTLPDVDPDRPMTTRERLSQHATDPNCRGCHNLTDPIGLALEHYDPVGAWRTTEWGLPIDARATVLGIEVDGGAELGESLVDHPRLPLCMVRQLYRHAIGQHESFREGEAITELTATLESGEHRLRAWIVDLVLHPAFRTVSPPTDGACAEEGAVQPCRTACGAGQRVCLDGAWRGCSAARPMPETCNGLDDDCDGVTDEAVRTCTADGRAGVETCEEGDWTGSCALPPLPPETCNGLDDDGDGEVDEELDIERVQTSAGALAARHPDCAILSDASSGPCRAAIHRTCAQRDCSTTGWGPIALDTRTGVTELLCVDGEQATPRTATYEALSAQHPACTEASPVGPPCNAAISRWCRAQGLRTGWGPVEHSGGEAFVMCTPEATTFAITYTDLAPFSPIGLPVCNGEEQRLGASCHAAIHGWCSDRGYRTGHGPLENNFDDVHVACLD